MFCQYCGGKNEMGINTCKTCNQHMRVYQLPDLSKNYYILLDPTFLKSLIIIGLLFLLTSLYTGITPLIQYIRFNHITSEMTTLLTIGLFVVGVMFLSIGWIMNLTMEEEILKMFYDTKDKLSFFRLILRASREYLIRFFLFSAVFFFVSGFIVAIRPLKYYFDTKLSKYYIEIYIAFGLEILSIFFFIMGIFSFQIFYQNKK